MIPAHLIESIENEADKYSDLLESSHHSTEVYHPASYYSGCNVGFEAGASLGYKLAMDEQDKHLSIFEESIRHYFKMREDKNIATIQEQKKLLDEVEKVLLGIVGCEAELFGKDVVSVIAKLKAHRGTNENKSE